MDSVLSLNSQSIIDAVLALKGQSITAQGNALGNRPAREGQALKGRSNPDYS